MKYFSILFVGSLVNSIGTGLTSFGLSIHMFDAYGTASSVALVQLCAFAPIVALAPVAGVLADRFDRRLMMIIGDAGALFGLAVVFAAVASPTADARIVYAGLAASSCFAALTEPALRASVSDMVSPDDYVRTSGMLQIAASAKYLLSPLLAGLLLPVFGVRFLLALDASTCLVTVACTFVVRRAIGHSAGKTGEQGFAAQMLDGWRAVASDAGVRTTVALMTVVTLAIGVLQVAVKPILLPHTGASNVGVTETLITAGMLGGAVLVAMLPRARPTTLLFAGMGGAGAAMVLLSLRHWTWWVAASGFFVCVALALCNAGAEVLVRSAIDDEYQARAWGTIGLVSQLGYLAAYTCVGPLADRVFGPMLSEDGSLAGSLGRVLGTGPGRGAAMLVAVTGAMTLGLAFLAMRGHARAWPSDGRARASGTAGTDHAPSGRKNSFVAEGTRSQEAAPPLGAWSLATSEERK